MPLYREPEGDGPAARLDQLEAARGDVMEAWRAIENRTRTVRVPDRPIPRLPEPDLARPLRVVRQFE
jgi:hypothetical protein